MKEQTETCLNTWNWGILRCDSGCYTHVKSAFVLAWKQHRYAYTSQKFWKSQLLCQDTRLGSDTTASKVWLQQWEIKSRGAMTTICCERCWNTVMARQRCMPIGREAIRPWTGYRVITGLTYRDNNTHPRTYRQFWVSLILLILLPAELDLWPPKSNQFVLEPKRVLVPKWKNICHSDWHLWHLYSQEVGRVPSSLLKKMLKTDSFLLCMCTKLGILLKSKRYRTLNVQQWNLQGRGFFMDYVYLQ